MINLRKSLPSREPFIILFNLLEIAIKYSYNYAEAINKNIDTSGNLGRITKKKIDFMQKIHITVRIIPMTKYSEK